MIRLPLALGLLLRDGLGEGQLCYVFLLHFLKELIHHRRLCLCPVKGAACGHIQPIGIESCGNIR